jgi:hypothetical protein
VVRAEKQPVGKHRIQEMKMVREIVRREGVRVERKEDAG